jgi:hypothetical protein
MIETIPYFFEILVGSAGAVIGMQIALYHKMNEFTIALSIICREHSINHGKKEVTL